MFWYIGFIVILSKMCLLHVGYPARIVRSSKHTVSICFERFNEIWTKMSKKFGKMLILLIKSLYVYPSKFSYHTIYVITKPHLPDNGSFDDTLVGHLKHSCSIRSSVYLNKFWEELPLTELCRHICHF